MAKEKKSRTTIYIDNRIKKKGRLFALKSDSSFSSLIERLIDDYVEEEGEERTIAPK